MGSRIDLDRGVQMWRQPVSKGGMYVYMYLNDPGIYINEHGRNVSEAFAESIGADIKKFQKERIKRERMAKAKKQIEAELEIIEEEVENTVKEVKGFTIIALPGDRANVKDPDGNLVNIQPITMADAEELLAALTEDAPAAEEPKVSKNIKK